MGGSNPAGAYRRFVESGLSQPSANPFTGGVEGWLLGSQNFVDRIKRLVEAPRQPDQVRQARQLLTNCSEVIAAVAAHYGVSPKEYAERGSTAGVRDLAAYLAHRYTTATLRDLAGQFGLSHPDSVSNLTRRAEKALAKSRALQADLETITNNLNT